MSDHRQHSRRVSELIEIGRALYERGWTPATSGNLSVRLDERRLTVTVSGKNKGRLTAADVMTVDLDGRAEDPTKRPSAETLLHCSLYRMKPETGAVLHVHSVMSTTFSRLCSAGQDAVFEGFEVQKAFPGFETHESSVRFPVFGNSQDMVALSREVEERLNGDPSIPAYLIQGHGIYTWGRDLTEAQKHLEAVEFLLACELELRRHRP